MSSQPPNGNDPTERADGNSGTPPGTPESPWEAWERENRPQPTTPTNPYGSVTPANPGAPANPYQDTPAHYGTNVPPAPPGQQPGPYGTGPHNSSPYQGWVAPPKPGVIPLRPLTVGEILDGAFQACRKNPVATFGTAIIVTVISTLLVGVLSTLVLSQVGITSFDSGTVTSTQAFAFAGAAGLTAIISAFFTTIFSQVIKGLLLIPVARAILNRQTSFTEMFRLGGKRIPPLLGFVLISLVAYAIGATLFVLLAVALIAGMGVVGALIVLPLAIGFAVLIIWITIKLSFAPPAIVLESAGVFAAIARSWTLIRGSWWRVFGITLLGGVIVAAITSLIQALVNGILGIGTMTFSNPEEQLETLMTLNIQQIISYIVVGIFSGVGAAFAAALLGLLYVDVRMRREGFEAVLLKEMEGKSEIPGAGPHRQGGADPDTSYGYRPGQNP